MYSTEMWTKQIQHFIENVVGEPAYVVGNSLGGYLAVQLASSSPQLVKGLILLNATPFWAFRPPSSTGGNASEPIPFVSNLDGTVPINPGVKRVIETFWYERQRPA